MLGLVRSVSLNLIVASLSCAALPPPEQGRRPSEDGEAAQTGTRGSIHATNAKAETKKSRDREQEMNRPRIGEPYEACEHATPGKQHWWSVKGRWIALCAACHKAFSAKK